MFTFIRLSYNAIIPASMQIDYPTTFSPTPTRMSAPDKSSFA